LILYSSGAEMRANKRLAPTAARPRLLKNVVGSRAIDLVRLQRL
jgi:hypothetical protein